MRNVWKHDQSEFRIPIDVQKELMSNIRTAIAGRPADVWSGEIPKWAILEPLGSSLDTQISDRFFFLEGSSIPTTIGRTKGDGDIRFRGDDISRAHCQLVYERGRWTLLDLDSTNRTYVNGRAVDPGVSVSLEDHDEIRLGTGLECRLRLRTSEGDGAALIHGLCAGKSTGLPGDIPLSQIAKRSVRKDGPTQLVLFAADDGQKPRGESEVSASEFLPVLSAAIAVVAPQAQGRLFVAELEGGVIAVLFRGCGRNEAAFVAQQWHSALCKLWTATRPNAALVTVRDVDDHCVPRARAALLACEFAGAGRFFDADVEVEWHRDRDDRFRSQVSKGPVPWLAVASSIDATRSHQHIESGRAALARALDRLPPRTRISIAWNVADSLFLIESTGSKPTMQPFVAAVPQLRFVDTDQGSLEWLLGRTNEVAARRSVDLSRMAMPLISLLSVDTARAAERFMDASTRLEKGLQLVAALLVAKLATDYQAEPGGSDFSLGKAMLALKSGREHADGLGTYLHLVTDLTFALTDGTFKELRALLSGKWAGKARAIAQDRNAAVHSGKKNFEELAIRIEGAIRELTRALVSPDVELVEVQDVQPRRTGGGRIRFVRLIGPVPQAPETIERADFTDQGMWLILGGVKWVRLHPWPVRKPCSECHSVDVFVASAVTANMGRPLTYAAMAHAHKESIELEESESVQEAQTLLDAVGRFEDPGVTKPGV